MLKHFDKYPFDKSLFCPKIVFPKLKVSKTYFQKHVNFKSRLEIEFETLFEVMNQSKVCV